MPINEFIEDISSHLPAMHLLINMGYTYLTPAETLAERNGKRREVILKGILEDWLKSNNRIHFKGQTHHFSEANIQSAILALADFGHDNLMQTNEAAYDLLNLGKSLTQTIAGDTKSFSLRYIDWDDPTKNVYHITDEYEVLRTGSDSHRRPDAVVFVNGIPLSIIEAKRPDMEHPIKEAISQQIRNQKSDNIPQLFWYSQILFAICQNEAKYGTTLSELRHWNIWKESLNKTEETIFLTTLHGLINTPISPAVWRKLFSHRTHAVKAKMEDLASAGERNVSPQDKILYAFFRPHRLLEHITRYIVYDKNVKKIDRHQQYFAVKSTMRRVLNVRGDEARPSGVIWHTTGSGKSLTMVMLAKALSIEPTIKNPLVVLVTDRLDLDEQISTTFRNCGKSVVQSGSGKHLMQEVQSRKADVITTIIDKFETAANFAKEKGEKFQDLSSDIFVLVDEGHRSQYGTTAAVMRSIFPNGCYIGFTGTPLTKKDKTRLKFGSFIHTYTMREAIQDGAVVPLLYEGRMAELCSDQKKLDRWFERVTVDLTPEQKADLKRKFQRESELHKADQRIAEIAYDINEHFKTNVLHEGLKGMVCCDRKETALRYQRYFEDFGDLVTEVIISPSDTRKGHTKVDDEDTPEVQRFWEQMMKNYGSEKNYLKTITGRFEDAETPHLLIVVSKLLTGFDAPRNRVLYIDKTLREHNILQAIARVNRLFKGKDEGWIIDYRGILGNLNEAIDRYDALENFDPEDVEGTIVDMWDEIVKLPERHTNVWEIFKTVSNTSDIQQMQEHLKPEDIRHRFFEVLNVYARTFQIAFANTRFQEETPEKKKETYRADLKYFIGLRTAVRRIFGETIDYSEYEEKIRALVDKYVSSEEVITVVEEVDIFAVDRFEAELSKIEGDKAKADAIEARLKKIISQRMDEDPLLYKKLSQLIDEAFEAYKQKRLSEKELLKKMLEVLDIARGKRQSDVPEDIRDSPQTVAFYRILYADLAEKLAENIQVEEQCAYLAVKIDQVIANEKIRDWTRNQGVINQMKNEAEDMLYSFKGRHDTPMSATDIESMAETLVNVAIRREREQG